MNEFVIPPSGGAPGIKPDRGKAELRAISNDFLREGKG